MERKKKPNKRDLTALALTLLSRQGACSGVCALFPFSAKRKGHRMQGTRKALEKLN